MNVRRGNVVILDFPQAPGHPPKRRPALVVQADHNNSRLTNSIFAMEAGADLDRDLVFQGSGP
jgi:mRNA-degrading endonuclease toxin of MazEF toxin-antitoxin module